MSLHGLGTALWKSLQLSYPGSRTRTRGLWSSPAHSSAAADSLASVSPVLSSESTGGPVWPGNWCAVPPDLGPQMMSCAGLWASLAVFPTPQQYPTLLLSTGPCSNHPGSLITESRQHRESFYKIVYVSHMLDTKESL